MRLAGERNFKPVSIFSGIDALKRHWEIYSEANIKAGFTPNRQRHAVSQTVFVADTDAEAKRLVLDGPIGSCFNRYQIPLWRRFGMVEDRKNGVWGPSVSVSVDFWGSRIYQKKKNIN